MFIPLWQKLRMRTEYATAGSMFDSFRAPKRYDRTTNKAVPDLQREPQLTTGRRRRPEVRGDQLPVAPAIEIQTPAGHLEAFSQQLGERSRPAHAGPEVRVVVATAAQL